METDSDGVHEAHMVRADGTHVTMEVDASLAVPAVQTGGRDGPVGMGLGGHRDDDGDGPHGMMGRQGESPVPPDASRPTTSSNT